MKVALGSNRKSLYFQMYSCDSVDSGLQGKNGWALAPGDTEHWLDIR